MSAGQTKHNKRHVLLANSRASIRSIVLSTGRPIESVTQFSKIILTPFIITLTGGLGKDETQRYWLYCMPGATYATAPNEVSAGWPSKPNLIVTFAMDSFHMFKDSLYKVDLHTI